MIAIGGEEGHCIACLLVRLGLCGQGVLLGRMFGLGVGKGEKLVYLQVSQQVDRRRRY